MLLSPMKNYGSKGVLAMMATLLCLCTVGCSKSSPEPGNPGPGKEPEVPTTPEEPNPDPLKLEQAFTVMSFNLRNPTASDPFSQLERMSKLTGMMKDHQVDILGVQELADNGVEEYVNGAMNEAGYDVYKTGAANGSPKSIFYKRERFSLVKGGHFLKEFVKETVISSAKWVILKDKTNGLEYFVINSHWYHTADAGQYRADFAKLILDCIRDNHNGKPVICMGDFNAIPGTNEINIIKNVTGYDMIDALMDTQAEYTFHNWTGKATKKLDYVLSTRDLALRGYETVKDKFTVDGKTMWPSDHFPVLARYIPAVFQAGFNHETAASAQAKTRYFFADVNGDGKKDKIQWQAGANAGKVGVYLSNGASGFQSTAIQHDASASSSEDVQYYFADVNGDKKADLIRWQKGQASGKTQVFLATSNGSFASTSVDHAQGASTLAGTNYLFADVNGDGKADKIQWEASQHAGQPQLYLATENGNFASSAKAIAVAASNSAASQFFLADINGDKKADLVRWDAGKDSGKALVYLAAADGTFALSDGFSNSGATSGLSNTRFYFSDINGDGKADKVYWNPTNYLGEPKIYLAGETGFDGPVYSLRGPSQQEGTHFFFADINGDKKADQLRWNAAENNGKVQSYLVR